MTVTTDFYSQMVERNIGVLSDSEQKKLRNSCVAVAGCGGMGGLSAEQLVRLGVGHVKIADFDTFAVHNLSRQTGSTTANVGENKAEVLEKHFKAINPELKIESYKEGVTTDNAEKFAEGAGVMIDGTDYSKLDSTVRMYQAARKNGICVVNPNAIGFGINMFIFGPKTTPFEEYLGIGKTSDTRQALKRLVPHIPRYINPLVLGQVMIGAIPIPNIAMPQYLGTAMAVSEAVMMLLGRIKAPEGPNPRVFVFDLQERKFEVKD